MSEISKARSKLSTINTLLKKKKFLAALVSIQDALSIFFKTPLLKHEKKDFQKKLEDVVYLLKINKEFVQQYPIPIEYTPGDEKKLWDLIKEAIKELQSSTVEEAKKQMALLEELKQQELEKGRKYLKHKEYNQADKVFKKLIKTFKEDTDLKLSISDIYLEEGMVDDALGYLRNAYKDDPEAIHVLNKMGITLRKAGKFDLAIKVFKEAISRTPDDEYLLFNLGRVYIDSKKWEDVLNVADNALKLNPDFKEAEKMLKYAERQIG